MVRAGYAGRLLFLFMALLTAILAGCGGKGGSDGGGGQASSSATIERLEVDPVDSQAAKGTTRSFTATAIFSNDSKQDVTREVTWSSSNTAIAAMDSNQQGLVHAVAEGKAVITASLQGKSASAELGVTPATLESIQIDPATTSMPKGTQVQLKVTALFSDGSSQDLTPQAEWVSSAERVAVVSNAPDSKGVVEGLTQGTAKISATVMSQTVETTVTVTNAVPTDIQITPEDPELGVGGELRFMAIATFSDGSKVDATYSPYVDWTSSDVSVATISDFDGPSLKTSDKGRAKALKEGVTTIVVNVPGLTLRDSVILRVVPVRLLAVEVEPSSASMGQGGTQQFLAYARYNDGTRVDVTRHSQTVWSSSQTSVATVSNAGDSSGSVKALAKGSTTISAIHGGMTGSGQLTVTDATVTSLRLSAEAYVVLPQTTSQFKAMGTFTDGSERDVTADVRWRSYGESAVISNAEGSKGLATGMADGLAGISADIDGVAHYGALEVEGSELKDIRISPSSLNLPETGSVDLDARATFVDDSPEISVRQAMTWSSSDDSVVTVSNAAGSKGKITGMKSGATAVITALDTRTGKKGTATITVTQAPIDHIEITPAAVTVSAGLKQPFTATIYYKNNTSQDGTEHVVWTTDDSSIAKVGEHGRGVVAALRPGQTTVRARVLSSSASAVITVTEARLDRIDVTPKDSTLRNGEVLQYQAIGSYSDGSTRAMTDLVTWSSSHTQWLTISNTDGSRGLAKAVGGATLFPVSVTVSASLESVTGSTTVTRSF